MKKIIFYASFLLLSFGSFSQGKNKTQKDTLLIINELKVETLLLTAGRLSAEYERRFHQNASYGLGFAFDILARPILGDGVHAFYKYYFQHTDDYTKGMFISGFLGIYQDKKYNVAPAAGFSVGKMWVHKKGPLLQIHLGTGTMLNGEGVFNGGIYFGYRFKSKKKIPKN